MLKRVFVVHGWDGFPEEGWFPWLKKELENKNFKVQVLKMPKPESPKIKTWVSFLAKSVKVADKNTYFVGHSMGCQTILRYLESLQKYVKVGGAIFVAGWFNLTPEATEEEGTYEIAEPWLKTRINFNKVLDHTNKFTAIFSSNDPFVSDREHKIFKSKLNAKIFLEKNKGHFSGGNNITKLPEVLNELLRISKS